MHYQGHKDMFDTTLCHCKTDLLRYTSIWPVSLGISDLGHTVKILKIGTPEIITIIILQFEQLDFTVQYCVQKMQTE